MSDGPASKLRTFQLSFINNGHRKENREFPLPSHYYEMNCLSENLSFIYGPASATYIQYETQNNFEEMSSHSVVHTVQKPFICDICWKGYTRKAALMRHKLTHTRNECAKGFRAVTGPSSSGNDEGTCLDCGKVFRTKANLKQHSVVHSKEKPFICDVCQKRFPRKGSLKKHKLIHSRNVGAVDALAFAGTSRSRQADRTCLECGKEFHSKVYLKQHSMVHSEVKPFFCDLCQKGFSRKSHLKTHQRTHTAEKPFQCEACGKAYRQKVSLKKHGLLHNGNI